MAQFILKHIVLQTRVMYFELNWIKYFNNSTKSICEKLNIIIFDFIDFPSINNFIVNQ